MYTVVEYHNHVSIKWKRLLRNILVEYLFYALSQTKDSLILINIVKKNDQKLLDEIYHSDEHVTEIKSTIEENSQNYLQKKRADNESKKQKIEQVYQQCMFFTATKY